ncbi:hypothetical protein N0V82_005565 [Gnomoniopsis sp. IMI 355080]|nr:hypothetical protein N0V82_005565 [Gnomoniopsis sp. IMI 355080]
MAPAKVVFGGGGFMSSISSDEQIQKVLAVLKESGIEKIDTGYTYGDSEECLGRAHASSEFAIDTKNPGGLSPDPSVSTENGVLEIIGQSLARLQTDHVDVYYLHAPDRRVPFADTLKGINQVYQSGAFRRFGLSNFLPGEVEEVVKICKENNYILPTVYQGSYSAIQRLMEDELLPILRMHKICYYAYSPSAGGFLAKTPEQLKTRSSTRWDPSNLMGEMYRNLFAKEANIEALGRWHEIADAEGISGIDMAYRWVVHNSVLDGSLGDSIVFGALKEDHLRSTIAAIEKGPLSENAVAEIDKIWERVKVDSHLDNFNGFLSQHFEKNPAAQSSDHRQTMSASKD